MIKDFMFLSAISGIMVDGVSVGDKLEYIKEDAKDGENHRFYSDFLSAEMVVVLREPLHRGVKTDEQPRFTVYGIYGNVIVSATASGNRINDINKKIIWAHRKPYILNGDWQEILN